VSDGIVRIHGLADVMYGEMIEFDGGLYGMALNLEQDSVGAVVLGQLLDLQEGSKGALHRPYSGSSGWSGNAGPCG
jgi:F-type H+-transporting ATPase subunit alpha